jgi:hypothetical protein
MRCFGCRGICEFCNKSVGYKILMTEEITIDDMVTSESEREKAIYFCCERCLEKNHHLQLIKFCPLCHRSCGCNPDKSECDKGCELNMNYKTINIYSRDQSKKKKYLLKFVVIA